MDKEWLYGKTISQLELVAKEAGMPRFAAKQMASWLYRKKVGDINSMTDISARHRSLLNEIYIVGGFKPVSEAISKDGTKKYLFESLGGGFIESAYIPDGERATLCVSSQLGCRMGCRFCMTARQALSHSLSAGEILNQIRSIPESESLTNVVYMGMGEPLDNTDEVLRSLEVLTSDWGYGWSPTRITVSTIGVMPELKRFLDESRAHLAVSLHNPFHDQRLAIMPAENKHRLEDVVSLLKQYDFSHQRRVSFEYIVMEGLNDSDAHIRELIRLLNGLKCRINLIRFHRIPGSAFYSPDDLRMTAFRDALTARGIMTTIRSSRGEDINAACGLLSTLEKEKQRAGSGKS